MKARTRGERRRRKKASSADFVVNPHAECIVVDVDNPYFNRAYGDGSGNLRKIKAMVNMRESPAAHWLHKEKIDTSQYRAAVKFRRLWEMGGGAGAGALDYGKEPVDGGAPPDPINIAQIDALRELRNIQAVLGPADYSLARDVCGACLPIGQIARTSHEQRKLSERCRHCLYVLADYWGFLTRHMRAG